MKSFSDRAAADHGDDGRVAGHYLLPGRRRYFLGSQFLFDWLIEKTFGGNRVTFESAGFGTPFAKPCATKIRDDPGLKSDVVAN